MVVEKFSGVGSGVDERRDCAASSTAEWSEAVSLLSVKERVGDGSGNSSWNGELGIEEVGDSGAAIYRV